MSEILSVSIVRDLVRVRYSVRVRVPVLDLVLVRVLVRDFVGTHFLSYVQGLHQQLISRLVQQQIEVVVQWASLTLTFSVPWTWKKRCLSCRGRSSYKYPNKYSIAV